MYTTKKGKKKKVGFEKSFQVIEKTDDEFYP